jgi:dihydroorotase/N-acyl-D-amino-acid deacylase
LFVFAAALVAAAQQYDVLITGARVVDGAGGPWFTADVAVSGDSIAAVGRLRGASARVVIDGRGLAVAPGFIDIHTHASGNIFTVPTAENYIRQGVTTLMEGNDGASPLPLGSFLDKVAGAHPGVNFGMFVGQGSLRTKVIGLENRNATEEEIARMQEMAREAMRQGAFGLSTGLYYVPGNFTPTEEVIAIARVVGEMGGIHISHMRNEGPQVLESVRETIRIGEEGGLPTQITHHKIMGRREWGRSVETLRLVEEARARGVDVTIDQYPYTASSTGTAALFPRWALDGGNKALLARLEDAATRARIRDEIARNIRENRGAGDPKNVVMAACRFDPSLAGKNLAQITGESGRTPSAENAAEAVITIQQKGGCAAIYHAIGEEDVERIMRYPFTMIASDGDITILGKASPHPRSYGTFARVLGYYVRERKVLGLEDAVRRMSSIPAARLGLGDRGLVRPGMKADLAVFDPATVADKATFENPHQHAAGVRHVFVNGRAVLLDGELTGGRPGRVLFGPAREDGRASSPIPTTPP